MIYIGFDQKDIDTALAQTHTGTQNPIVEQAFNDLAAAAADEWNYLFLAQRYVYTAKVHYLHARAYWYTCRRQRQERYMRDTLGISPTKTRAFLDALKDS